MTKDLTEELKELRDGLVNGTYNTDDVIEALLEDTNYGEQIWKVFRSNDDCDAAFLEALDESGYGVDWCIDYIQDANPQVKWHHRNGEGFLDDTYLVEDVLDEINYLIDMEQ